MGWVADLLREIPLSARYKSELEAMERENAELKAEIRICRATVEDLRQVIKRRDDVAQNEKSHADLLKVSKMKWGCITFPPDPKLYCPSCFHNGGRKVETARIDSHYRFCAACRAKLPSG